MPRITVGKLRFDIDDGEQLVAHSVARFVRRAVGRERHGLDAMGLLVVTDRRIRFVAAGWTTTLLRRTSKVLLDRPRANLANVEQATGTTIFFHFGADDAASFTFDEADHARWLVLLSPPTTDTTDRVSATFRPGLVTERACGSCRTTCRCSSPILVPTALVGWEEIFRSRWPAAQQIDRILDDNLSTDPIHREDVVEIPYLAEGDGDGPPWIAVTRLRDGRWVYLSLTVQITGDVFGTIAIAASCERLWWGALTEDDRDRFTAQMTPEARADELVEIDALQESDDADRRTLGEARMLQLHKRNLDDGSRR